MYMSKIALSANNDKRILLVDFIETNGYKTRVYYIKMKKLTVIMH